MNVRAVKHSAVSKFPSVTAIGQVGAVGRDEQLQLQMLYCAVKRGVSVSPTCFQAEWCIRVCVLPSAECYTPVADYLRLSLCSPVDLDAV